MQGKQYKATEKLKNQQILLIRSITPQDKTALDEGFHHLSQKSVYNRFHGPKKDLTNNELTYFTEVDHHYHVALLGILQIGENGKLVGVGRYVCVDRTPPLEAELAITVDDAYHNLGVGTSLMKHLIVIAAQNGVHRLEADVLSDNTGMLRILFNCGLPQSTEVSQGETHVTLSLVGGSD